MYTAEINKDIFGIKDIKYCFKESIKYFVFIFNNQIFLLKENIFLIIFILVPKINMIKKCFLDYSITD